MDYQDVEKVLRAFRDDRGWQKYHTLPALSRALSIEAAEVSEHFLWRDAEDGAKDAADLQALKMEIADVLAYAYFMCMKLDVDPNALVMEKMAINQHRHWDQED
ncbi:nucleotide pyrophosphohydrolase [Secundilactobacillus kimchicus]|uniref:Nucleotide pyrophosphohydrolase n=1 Tax=Secundilactobacillus kimchicus JCM 15530 TaxID=1302272 RepID=A0A0R1HX05_9LACO|nr:nucleotide pyrophosphohydrolase [Secundilactobacillus kimchicus]KRK48404.1 hypothetical protein FC96_GL001506 [Secundilactobacillus kimchicus JCM 15530]MBT9671152.1 nucleotide pyrophosphohydrolase [Secundilactobacillus kimchicus]